MSVDLETAACTPATADPNGLNPDAIIPYGCTPQHVLQAMHDFEAFLGFVNTQLRSRGTERLESLLMEANFSSIVGEYLGAAIPKYCAPLVRNLYHNGHPDLIPAGRFPGDAVQYAHEGIEVKASRKLTPSGWQGHNPEAVYLLLFIIDCNGPKDTGRGILPRPFRFLTALGAQLELADWRFSGRGETSRRTITASITDSGYAKLTANWIYRAPGFAFRARRQRRSKVQG
jgi:hypothetical protein